MIFIDDVIIQVVHTEQQQQEHWELTDEGREIVEHGSHEARIFNSVLSEKGILQSELMVKWIKMDPSIFLPIGKCTKC